jgi:hypothetical protein
MPGGKVKTSAIAAFLGNLGLYRQKEWDCGAEVKFRALNPGIVDLKNTRGRPEEENGSFIHIR